MTSLTTFAPRIDAAPRSVGRALEVVVLALGVLILIGRAGTGTL